MRLDLLRHGDALAVADPHSGERPLSARGIADVERLGRRLGATGWRPDRAFASPRLRAHDSAERLLRSAGVALEVGTLPELDPERGTAEEVLASLADLAAGARHLLLTGHQPLLGQLAWALCGSTVPFSPATLAAIELPGSPLAGSGRLLETLGPDAL